MAYSQGIPLKKQFGQHFLRDVRIVHTMIFAVEITPQTSIFEIGCGDGFLTKHILSTPMARLKIFEIDPDWAHYVQETFKDERLSVLVENFLDIDFTQLEEHKPWTVLANLPYQVTFPILHRFQEHRHLLKEGVVMIQEEVAQKIVKQRGRGYGYPSLFFQHYFEWKLLDKIPPTAFHPAPKVFSRLIYFKPRTEIIPIAQEEKFWKFIKHCFKQPRRTLRNNLAHTHYKMENLSENLLALRAQELSMKDLLDVWELVR
ncbi:MAG TPA: 16S rRNA (adenine(1518)-N(6)/adenine(1519)-N(6))-dimethyltransferase RsmA [Candidatus Babeliales bacterium]|nr:16S rRNA (adenine(1518)-N(6)/adenine(1519)-N(6))-dimethyltransferase RsmA [Candidatus Babeliales bacterium]